MSLKQRLLMMILPFYAAAFWLCSCDGREKNNPIEKTLLKATDSINHQKESFARAPTAFFKMDTLDQLPDDFKALVKGCTRRVYRVDFNGDGKQDFICEHEEVQRDSIELWETWITSDKEIKIIQTAFEGDVDYFWFVNLDKDPEPEYFSATGFEDGVDYAFYDQDPKTGFLELLFYFDPIIIENGKHFWGYPWDIKDIIVKKEAGNIYLRSSIDHDIVRDDADLALPADTTKKFPAICFSGHSTQPFIKVGEIRKIKWRTIDQLK
jgi:hypothetical protein